MKQTKSHIFKTFPEFSRLQPSDRDKYQSMIAEYPPYAEFAFSNLMTWWSVLSNCSVSQLNGNLIISYWFPGHEEYSGLSVLGTHDIDETVAALLDYLKQSGRPARLVHVPEFVASSLRYPELFTFKDERNYDECILSVADMNNLGGLIRHKRWKVRRFLTEVDESRVLVKSLDLSRIENQQLLLDAADEWKSKGGLNDICKREREALAAAVERTEELDIENVCIFIDGALHSFFMYQVSEDEKYALLTYARVSYAMPHIFEFIAYKNAQWFTDRGIEYINIKYDLGVQKLRSHKLALRPANFFRKYTIEPAS